MQVEPRLRLLVELEFEDANPLYVIIRRRWFLRGEAVFGRPAGGNPLEREFEELLYFRRKVEDDLFQKVGQESREIFMCGEWRPYA
jgi:hypothetical protein